MTTIQFPAIKKATLSNDKTTLLLEFDLPGIFDTKETFGENRTPNKQAQWKVENIILQDPSKAYTAKLENLAKEIGEELELFLDQQKTQLNLFPKESPHITGFKRDSQRINATLVENRKELEIQLNEKVPKHAFSYEIIGQTFKPAKARRWAIQSVKQIWKDNQSDQTETGTINGKSITGLLGTNWENDFANKNTREEIGEYEQQLRNKILNLIRSQLIKITFTKKNIQVEEENEYSEKKRLTLELEQPTDLTFYCWERKKNLTWKVKKIYFKSEQDSEYYDLLTDEDNQNFEFTFPFSEFFYFLNDINPGRDRSYSVYASETWTPNGTLEINHFNANLWSNGTIVLKETDSEKPDPKLNNDLTNLLDQALSLNSTEQDKITALKKSGELLGFISPENQTKITKINQLLANISTTKLSQALSEKIEKELTANNLIINDLPLEGQNIYQNIKNGSLTGQNLGNIQTEEQKLTQIIGETGAKKNLDNLETQIRQVLSSSDLEAKKRLQKLLGKFIKSQNTFYQTEKPRAQQLNRELKESIQKNDFNQNSETPWEKIILFSCIGIGITFIILLVYNLSKSSRRRKYTY